MILATTQKGSFQIDHGTFKGDGKNKRTDVRENQMTEEQVYLKHSTRRKDEIIKDKMQQQWR